MGWTGSKDLSKKKMKYNEEYSQIKSFVNKDVYNIFKGVVQLNNKTIKEALTDAMRDWIFKSSSVNIECNYCYSRLGYIYYTKYNEGDLKYYCSIKCLMKGI